MAFTQKPGNGSREKKNQEQEPTNCDEKKEQEAKLEKLEEHLLDTREKLREMEQENEELLARLQRARADFSNYKKRIEKDRFQDRVRAQEELILELFPVMDNFNRALEVSPRSKEARNLCRGVEMIYKQLWDVLEKRGLEEIEALNQPFDPNFHEAVERVNYEDKPAEMVVEVLQKGFKLGDKVLRPSMVKVNKGGDEDE